MKPVNYDVADCYLCGDPVFTDEAFKVDTSGNSYHASCVSELRSAHTTFKKLFPLLILKDPTDQDLNDQWTNYTDALLSDGSLFPYGLASSAPDYLETLNILKEV